MMWRIWAIFTILAALFALITIRLFYWQVVAAGKLRLEAASQYYLQFNLPASRGSILVSDSPLAVNQPAYLVYAEPNLVSDPESFAKSVAPILGLDSVSLVQELGKPGRVWLPLGRKIDLATSEELKALSLAGLGLAKEPKRFYPEASMAAHLLGFVGSDVNGKDKGYFGLEGYYDRELQGRDGVLEREKDAKGVPILIGETRRVEAQDGRDLVLWLDRSVQLVVEKRLLEGIRKYGAKAGSVVVVDPQTGGILAMAAYPNYDPGRYTLFEKSLYQNPVVGSAYEPGSTFKPLVMAAALEEKVVTPKTTMEEKGPVVVGEYTIRTWNSQYHGTIDMTKVLEYSSNIGMVFVARQLGQKKLIEYLRKFGFGEPTGVDLEGEASPLLRKESEWHEIDLLTASFGQGIAVTPIQMVRALAVLANGGWLVEPQVVSQIRGSGGKTVVIKPKRVRQVISEGTSRVITEMLVSAVDNGEAKWAKPKGYRIAGKTGTAQIPVAGHYDEEKTIASFGGFAPADNPKFVMLVTLQEPTSSPWGSETAAPLFFTIARDLFAYWGLSPQ